MNTEDERREEYTRKIQERRSLELSQSNLLNVGQNGHVMCNFNSDNLEEMKTDNSYNCYWSIRRSFRTFLHKRFPQLAWNKGFCENSIIDNGNYLFENLFII